MRRGFESGQKAAVSQSLEDSEGRNGVSEPSAGCQAVYLE